MVDKACAIARREAFGQRGDFVVIASGMPFGVAGTTNFLHIAKVRPLRTCALASHHSKGMTAVK